MGWPRTICSQSGQRPRSIRNLRWTTAATSSSWNWVETSSAFRSVHPQCVGQGRHDLLVDGLGRLLVPVAPVVLPGSSPRPLALIVRGAPVARERRCLSLALPPSDLELGLKGRLLGLERIDLLREVCDRRREASTAPAPLAPFGSGAHDTSPANPRPHREPLTSPFALVRGTVGKELRGSPDKEGDCARFGPSGPHRKSPSKANSVLTFLFVGLRQRHSHPQHRNRHCRCPCVDDTAHSHGGLLAGRQGRRDLHLRRRSVRGAGRRPAPQRAYRSAWTPADRPGWRDTLLSATPRAGAWGGGGRSRAGCRQPCPRCTPPRPEGTCR